MKRKTSFSLHFLALPEFVFQRSDARALFESARGLAQSKTFRGAAANVRVADKSRPRGAAGGTGSDSNYD
jgi:hypothetical protein